MKKFNLKHDDIIVDFTLPENQSEKEEGLIRISSTVPIRELYRDIVNYRKIDELERRTNFTVSINEANTEIVISGNLYNALTMMQVRGLLIREKDLDRLRQSSDRPTFDECIEFTKTVKESDYKPKAIQEKYPFFSGQPSDQKSLEEISLDKEGITARS